MNITVYLVYITPGDSKSLVGYSRIIDCYENSSHNNQTKYNVISCYSKNRTNNRSFPLLF